MPAPTITLGAQTPHLRLRLRRRSAQGFVLTLTNQATGAPVDLGTSPVVIEIDRHTPLVGSVQGSSITWALTADQTDLTPGIRGATLVRDPDGARDVWATGVVEIA